MLFNPPARMARRGGGFASDRPAPPACRVLYLEQSHGLLLAKWAWRMEPARRFPLRTPLFVFDFFAMSFAAPLLSRLRFMRHWLPALLAAAFSAAAPAQVAGLNVLASGAPGDEVATPQVRAQLLAYAPQGVPVGAEAAEAANTARRPVWLGLRLEHQPHWHTYWKNPGDSGLPTKLEWTLPPGVRAGEIQWPLPQRLPLGPLVNYGYEGTVLLPVPLTITPEFEPGPAAEAMEVRLHASWLVCKQECIPQEGDFAIRLPLRGSSALNGAAFEQALGRLPADLPSGGQTATLSSDGQRLQMRISGLPASVQGQPLQWFPETGDIIAAAVSPAREGAALTPATWSQKWEGDVWTASLPVADTRFESPAALPLLLAAADGQSWRAHAEVQGQWPAVQPPGGVSPQMAAALQEGAAASAPSSASSPAPSPAGAAAVPARVFFFALLGALLGGMVLNLMPCVFPVLAIKVIGFARHGDNLRAQRAGGLAYTAGVVLSFVLLGGLMLALRAAGAQLGWGFQLQSPLVIALLAALFAVLGLNLAGVFEFGQFLPSRVASLQAENPVIDSFLSGVLAVAVASPCTAPFMGASLGLAIGLPAAQALAIFAALGLGMALPYLAASWLPALARRLPRPGAWMEVFKKFMAFPMFATATWLLWVLGQQSGINGAAALLMILVALAMLLWALGLQGRARIGLAAFAAAALIGLLAGIGPNVTHLEESAAATGNAASAGSRWQPWSDAAVQAALSEGHPVFIDYTAAWCVTCQYNKKTTLASQQVLDAFDAAGVRTFRADWTRRDPVISAHLQSLGRSGVPTYVLQAKGRQPQIFSEVIGIDEILAGLKALEAAP